MIVMNYAESLNKLTRQFNDAVRSLQNAYHKEVIQLGWYQSSTPLRRQYSKKYESLMRQYRNQSQLILVNYQQANPDWARWRKIWGRVFFFGILMMVCSCVGQLAVVGSDESPAPAASQALNDATAETYWNADNIPIPYLKDSTQYVSNPDYVLSQQTVDQMNQTYRQMESQLGIQSVVIVVKHIENDDPFRMAQDVGNKYGVGHQDMGLVIVCGYEDHSINMSPGKKLEADLTDAECHRLQQEYVVPAMRREMPDSAMLYLTEAIFSTLQKKQLPVMSLKSQADEADETILAILGIYLLLFIGFCAFYLHLNSKYCWAGTIGTTLLGNPFYTESHSGGGFYGGGGGFGGGHSGGGGFGGGSFGGGSFGGGGATSRW